MSYDFSFDKKSAILIVTGCVAVGLLLFFAGYIVGLDRGQNQPTVQASLAPQNGRAAKNEPEKALAPPVTEKTAALLKKGAPEKGPEPSAANVSESKSSEAPSDAKSSSAKEGDAKDKDKDKNTFSLQLGAFQTEENALKLRDNLKSKGYPVFLFRVTDEEGHLWHMVRMGHYADKKEASKAAAKVTGKQQISAWVRPSNAF
jgi:cell division septation protein DedD